MAKVMSRQRRVVVTVTSKELSTLITDKAKEAKLIDFDPTRVKIDEEGSGYSVIFERVTTDGS